MTNTEYQREWRKNNPEQMKATRKAWRDKNKEHLKNEALIRTFGISLKDYKEMQLAQGNVCLLCKKPETLVDNRTNNTKQLSVDHCHDTGTVRGLLCNNCNVGLGHFKDNIKTLELAISYLKQTKKQEK